MIGARPGTIGGKGLDLILLLGVRARKGRWRCLRDLEVGGRGKGMWGLFLRRLVGVGEYEKGFMGWM